MVKAIIEANINEDKYSVYNSIYDLKTLSEYYSKLPNNSETNFVKFMKFTGNQAAIYNISDILVSPNVADGSEGKKKVQIVYSGDEASKVWDVKKFSDMCKKIFDVLKNDKPEDVEVEAILEGQNKPTKFRFYYDSDNGFAILVNGTNTKGLETFINNYEGDLQGVVSVPKVTKAPKPPKEKKERKPNLRSIKITKEPTKKNDHTGYVCIDSSDSFGHRVRIWKKDPDYTPESEVNEVYIKPFLHDVEENGDIITVRQLKDILNKNFKDTDILDFCSIDGEPGYKIKAIWNSNMEYEMTGDDDGRDNVCYIRISE